MSNEYGISTRVCEECGEDLPLTATVFDRDNHDELGFKRICKRCRSVTRQKKEDQKLDERLQRFDKATIVALEKAIDQGTSVPHMAEIWEQVISLLGGVGGFAGHIVAQMMATPLGKKERTAMLSMLIKLGDTVTKSGVATVPMDMLTDEDLERMHKTQLQMLLNNQKAVAESYKLLDDHTKKEELRHQQIQAKFVQLQQQDEIERAQEDAP